jgi:hypothetical protein
MDVIAKADELNDGLNNLTILARKFYLRAFYMQGRREYNR